MQIESLNNTSLCNTNTMAFMEELLNLEYLQDTTNEVGNFLTQHITKDYGFSVNLRIEGVNIKDEQFQKILREADSHSRYFDE
ncbi:hypothetical protein HPU229336_06285 [Helicobacter pullorum]|uniref:Uncharacterized protein n=2 Tax=Helicobacter pullorum TaxID=35818 RepID=A0AAW3J9T6_9HELI|nr:hypothetical protein [Helicobacter pullorum]KPH51483.1 hypothetical protein HPU229336_06285 [Helicobacter pullorum]